MKYYDLLGKNVTKHGYEKADTKLNFVKGGSLEKNQKAVRSKIDVLLDPVSQKMSVDSAVVQIAKDNDITFGITLQQFLETRGFKRIRLIVNYRKVVAMCRKKKVRILLTTGAQEELDMRPPLQLASLGVLLGMTEQQAKWSISKVPEYLIA